MADVKELNINNTTYDIKAKSVVDTNSGAVKFWTGTKAQYDVIVTKDSSTLYTCTDSGEIYLGTELIANDGANKSLSNLDATGQAVIDGKADVDLSNATDTADIRMAHNAMPSSTTISLTLGASGTIYTMPADGYLSFQKVQTTGGSYMRVCDADTNSYGFQTNGGGVNSAPQISMAVSKGQRIVIYYDLAGQGYLVFTYAKGSESEAQ